MNYKNLQVQDRKSKTNRG